MSANSHQMTTRSKAKESLNDKLYESSDMISDDDSSVDENGNLKGFIDYDCDESFDQEEFDKQLNRLRGVKPKRKLKRNNKKKNDKKLNDVFMTYLILKATEKANIELKKNRKQKQRNKVKVEVSDDSSEESVEKIVLDEPSTPKTNLNTILTLDFNTDSDDTSFKGSDNKSDSGSETSENSQESSNSDESSTPKVKINKSNQEEKSSDEEYSYEYDDMDEKYEELIDKQMLKNSEESNMEYYHYLEKEKKAEIYKLTQEIYEYNGSNIPLRFKVIESHMDMKTKAIALENIDKMSEMDVSTGEHSKMDHWINGLMRIPFGKYNSIPINPDNSIHEKREFIKNTYKTLDKSIYGHKEAKTHILQVIGKWMKNPDSGGNVLAIQGPMGNGKTTLVKEGISKVLNRPFHFIALGGASDSAYFDGHCYTYEGSHWGRIVQILQDSKCMNPIIYFDELDKVSETVKGDEIINMLIHMTDSSQNSKFQDNYFPGVHIDLSKILFIFSYNDESKVNKILKDRMYVINTRGFNVDDKIKITNEYLLKDVYETYNISSSDIIFTNEIIKEIILNYTHKEEGVRNLKRCIESIVSKINIYQLTYNPNEEMNDLSFKIKDFQYPFTITEEHLPILLNKGNNDLPPPNMYL
mgnify:CR=1 FL=1